MSLNIGDICPLVAVTRILPGEGDRSADSLLSCFSSLVHKWKVITCEDWDPPEKNNEIK